MARVIFTSHLRRFADCPEVRVPGTTLLEVLDAVFASNGRLRGYVLDDQGALRKHVNVFIDGGMVRDRARLGDPVGPDADIYVMQALSGG